MMLNILLFLCYCCIPRFKVQNSFILGIIGTGYYCAILMHFAVSASQAFKRLKANENINLWIIKKKRK